MSFTFSVSGGTKYKGILEKIAEYRKGVKAGVPSGATNASTGASIVEYGIYNELGAPNAGIPSRPFMRKTQAEKQSSWGNIISGNLKFKDIQNNGDGPLVICGEVMKADIKENIQRGSWEPDAEATVRAKERKGKGEATHPLIDTGDLLKSIIYEVFKL
jgi:hypothetical protein